MTLPKTARTTPSNPSRVQQTRRRGLRVALQMSLASMTLAGTACGKSDAPKKQSPAASDEPTPKAERPTRSGSDSGDEPPAAGEPSEPSIASSVGGASKKIVEKTETVEREAADLGASHAAARTIASDPRLSKLVEDAAGKTLHIPTGALDHFYAQLAALPKPSASDGAKLEPSSKDSDAPAAPQVVRVLHIGDSFIGQDIFPHAIRRRMQARYGDAGPGFQLADVHHRANISRALELRSKHFRSKFVRDAGRGNIGRFGYGGHIARGGPGATSWLAPRDAAPFASGKGHVEVWYQAHPKGAELEIQVGESVKTVDTASASVTDAWARVPLDTPSAEVQVTARGQGRALLYGAAFETGEPGVVWDSTVHTATFTNRVLAQDPEHFAGQIAHRGVDLLVFNFGGNDLRRVAKGNLTKATFAEEIGEVIDLYRSGRPEMSCLVVSSTDHAKSGRTEVLPKHVERVVAAQRAAAEAKGCAFFDSLSVFGGVGMARTWAKRKHPLVGRDLSHLTSLGRELLAEVLVAELVRNQPDVG